MLIKIHFVYVCTAASQCLPKYPQWKCRVFVKFATIEMSSWVQTCFNCILLDAVNAMQDAMILANCLSDLGSLDMEAISVTFKDYHEQRSEHARNQHNFSLLTLSSSLA